MNGLSLNFVTNFKAPGHRGSLKALLSSSCDAFIAVAFLKSSGLKHVIGLINGVLLRGGKVTFVVGKGFFITEPSALRELVALRDSYCDRFSLYFFNPSGSVTFHPKYYRSYSGDVVQLVVGSSNLTSGGLFSNIEISVSLTEVRGGVLNSQVDEWEAALMSSGSLESIDDGSIDAYESGFKQHHAMRLFVSGARGSSSSGLSSNVFVLKSDGAVVASGVFVDGYSKLFLVLKGSFLCRDFLIPKSADFYNNARLYFCDIFLWHSSDSVDGGRVIDSDYCFSSPSIAATVVLGEKKVARDWVDLDGRPLDSSSRRAKFSLD